MREKPELAEIITPKIAELQQQFDDLERTTKEKGERLFDANRETLIHQTCDDIDSWMTELEKQIESEDTGSDLASVNILIQKQQARHFVSLSSNRARTSMSRSCVQPLAGPGDSESERETLKTTKGKLCFCSCKRKGLLEP